MSILGPRVLRPGESDPLGREGRHIVDLPPDRMAHVTWVIPPDAHARIRPLGTAC